MGNLLQMSITSGQGTDSRQFTLAANSHRVSGSFFSQASASTYLGNEIKLSKQLKKNLSYFMILYYTSNNVHP